MRAKHGEDRPQTHSNTKVRGAKSLPKRYVPRAWAKGPAVRKRGFTLVEMVVVLSIIALILAMMYYVYSKVL